MRFMMFLNGQNRPSQATSVLSLRRFINHAQAVLGVMG
ncbi:hypothetical protein AO385_1530 [Moraxella catarrhalis]|uniref:Uncharacterized protein n=1 Tax=Moraxella catarrhalis TaxID=480 RepID=A0A198UV14_MORCA|nr:hypothetical protein AO383_1811 [Moraxella catarrhalis]OAU98006.1 hypothetical protein AO384_0253 [Moraxella catarrhalis]OAU98904.1 hypothetical protein AO385_1530 [Moraxella catarrhalis]OAV00369.1 hypothetical protein AO382_1519 [Moraxella catarrhalis]